MIRVGRCFYQNRTMKYLSFNEFIPIIVLTKSSKYGALGPYLLKDEENIIHENFWQFQKIYETIPYSKQRRSQFDNTVVWEWPAETHLRPVENYDVLPEDAKIITLSKEKGHKLDGDYVIQPEYYKWREAGQKCSDPIRYPVGKTHRSKCVCLLDYNMTPLNYVESREQIYLKKYRELVLKVPLLQKLLTMLRNGQNY